MWASGSAHGLGPRGGPKRRCRTGSRELITSLSDWRRRFYPLRGWTWHGPPGHIGQVEAHANAPTIQPRSFRRQPGGMLTRHDAAIAQVRVIKPTDNLPLICEKIHPVSGGKLYPHRRQQRQIVPASSLKQRRGDVRGRQSPPRRSPLGGSSESLSSGVIFASASIWAPASRGCRRCGRGRDLACSREVTSRRTERSDRPVLIAASAVKDASAKLAFASPRPILRLAALAPTPFAGPCTSSYAFFRFATSFARWLSVNSRRRISFAGEADGSSRRHSGRCSAPTDDGYTGADRRGSRNSGTGIRRGRGATGCSLRTRRRGTGSGTVPR